MTSRPYPGHHPVYSSYERGDKADINPDNSQALLTRMRKHLRNFEDFPLIPHFSSPHRSAHYRHHTVAATDHDEILPNSSSFELWNSENGIARDSLGNSHQSSNLSPSYSKNDSRRIGDYYCPDS